MSRDLVLLFADNTVRYPGGRLVTAPCSHFGHIFRSAHPYTIPGASIHSTFIKNSVRLAHVWMDDYIKYFLDAQVGVWPVCFVTFLMANPCPLSLQPAARGVAPGDISERIALRKRLKCKPFDWFMHTVLPDMFVPRWVEFFSK